MITFAIGLIILIVGGFLYGGLCEKVFQPDDRKTPAYTKSDGVDYVPMPKWKNSLINLLNIAGTGPIIGPVQGILFGPVALISIPVGCVIGGAMHDYFSGMIAIRDGGIQMPEMVDRYIKNKAVSNIYTAFICILLFFVGVVFIYTPGDIAATQVFGFGGGPGEKSTWIIYTVIFVYYLIASVFPIDKIIGTIYPFFGAVLFLSALGLFVMLFAKGFTLPELWQPWVAGGFDFAAYFRAEHFIPNFFVTVACGILSGFHATQTSMLSRTVKQEKEGRMAYYNMMLVEGFIALVWAAAAMAMISIGAENGGITMQMTDGTWIYYMMGPDGLQPLAATSVIGVICRNLLGPVGGMIAIIGVIVLPITSGDTALRSLRIMLSDRFKINQDTSAKRMLFALPLFVAIYVLLIIAKMNPNGFNIFWKYFGWGNQMLSLFTLPCITIYLMHNGKKKYIWMSLIPLAFYAFVTSSYILSAKVGFGLPMQAAYAIAGVFTAVVVAKTVSTGSQNDR